MDLSATNRPMVKKELNTTSCITIRLLNNPTSSTIFYHNQLEIFMLRTAVTTIFLGITVTTSCFASNAFNTILFSKSHLPKTKIQNTVTKNAINNNTDFSGNWMGSCSYIEGPVPIEIEQSNDSITIDGQDFKFGAMTTIASSDTDSYDNAQMRFTWNPTKTTLTLNGTSITTDNSENSIYTFISEASMTLNNGQLVMKIKANVYSNVEAMADTLDGSCSFTKAP